MSGPATSIAGRRVIVEVAGSIANLGAGYDCLGLAVDLVLRVEIEAVERFGGPRVRLATTGEGAGEIQPERGNRVVEALEAGLRARGIELAGLAWDVRMENAIPLARGLGSSGAAAVAGLRAAAALADPGTPGDQPALIDAATTIEGHPDNVAPAVLGGFVASVLRGGRVTAYRFDAPASLRVVLFVPERRLETRAMREVLPAEVPRADAIANLARVAAGVAGIAQGDWSVLDFITEDRLHEPYRAAAFRELPALVAAAREAGALGACLAGAGSTIAAFTLGSTAETEAIAAALSRAASASGLAGETRLVRPRNEGPVTEAPGP